MTKSGSMRMTSVIAAALALSACVTLPPGHPRSPQDPWESWNRGVYKFNHAVDHAVIRPTARGYVKAVPRPIRTGVSNFFANLTTPTVMINDALQGKFKAAGNDLGRFLLNSTVGIAGILDPATSAGLDRNEEDFGLTLGHWGVHPGPFLELPILGPSDLRDGPAKLVDHYTMPSSYVKNTYISWGMYLPYLIDIRASLLSLDATIDQAYDPYAFIRDAFLARRAYLVSDGKAIDTELVDPGADDTSAPAGAPISPPPSPTQPPASGQPPAPEQPPASPATQPPADPVSRRR